MFSFSGQPIDWENLKSRLANPKAGAINTFEGLVRNHNEGRAVLTLEYEAYEPLAIKEAAKIIDEAKNNFDVYDIACVHRTGTLAIGDLAVWVGVSAAHRGTAFSACQYVIDQVKLRLPIWKKETYTDGSSGWVNCQSCAQHAHAGNLQSGNLVPEDLHSGGAGVPPAPNAGKMTAPSGFSSSAEKIHSHKEAEYYSRQMLLPAVAAEGQEKLRSAKVLVIGAGGLGSSALLYLAGAGAGTIGICDSDKVELSNLHRQVLYSTDEIGINKAQAAAIRLSKLNPFIKINVYPERFTDSNADCLFTEYDIVLDCSDNFKTKFLANDTALRTAKPLIQASIYQYEGQIHLVHRFDDLSYNGQCLRCLWPNITKEAEELSCAIGSCAEVGVLGVVPGTFGTLQALEGIKHILGLPTALTESVLIMDLVSYDIRKIKRLKSAECRSCAPQMVTANSHARVQQNKSQTQNPQPASEVADALQKTYAQTLTLHDLVVIDVREPNEILQSSQDPKLLWPRAKIMNVPFSQFSVSAPLLESHSPSLIVCARGSRGIKAAQQLRMHGSTTVFSLSGGLDSVDAADVKAAVAAGAKA